MYYGANRLCPACVFVAKARKDATCSNFACVCDSRDEIGSRQEARASTIEPPALHTKVLCKVHVRP